MEIKRKIFPPMYLLLGLILIWYLHVHAPLLVVLPDSARWIGVVVLVLGIIIIILAAGSFRQQSTPLIPFKKPEALVEKGLYRYTRNPMYVGMLLVLIGAALRFGSLSPWLVPTVFAAIIHYRFILGEELLLEHVFGKSYVDYKSRVRRWL